MTSNMTDVPTGRRPSVAVVGAGVSGLTAAYLLSRTHRVALFEAAPRTGGHAETHDVVDVTGAKHAVDSGFIVHNDRTYPLLRRLFRELEVPVRRTEMSMSVSCEECGLEYSGGRGAKGAVEQLGRLRSKRFRRLLMDTRRFHARAADFLKATDDDDLTTFGEFLSEHGFSEHFVSHYAVALVSCVWSTGRALVLEYPARYLFRFLDQHGLLRFSGAPQWYTVVGGSRTYVERVCALLADVRTERAVTDIRRGEAGVYVTDVAGVTTTVDRVVIASHADQALAMLADPTDDEVSVLKQFTYSENATVLHTDRSLLPRSPATRASWNYRMRSCARSDEPVAVTYWMNRLQGLDSPQDFLVTLNDGERIEPESVVATMRYEHPVYTPEAVGAQARLADLAGERTAYAGAYHGWGFHEDGCRSGVAAARHFGVEW